MIYLLEAREWEENQSQVQLFNDNNALKGFKNETDLPNIWPTPM